MIRKLKALRLALVAVFAFNAVAASGASAQSPGVLTPSGEGPWELDITATASAFAPAAPEK